MSSSHSFHPRHATSRQWTALPLEFTSKVGDVFAKQFEFEALKGQFFVEGCIYPEEILVRIGYLENGRLKQVNFEASIDIPKARKTKQPVSQPKASDADDAPNETANVESKTMELLYTCIDAIGSLMEEYFDLDEEDDEEFDVPYTWQPYEFEGSTVYLQYSSINTRLEEEADRLLGLLDEHLFNESSPSEDALQKAEIDSELALAVQKAIREGKMPFQAGSTSENDGEAN